MGWDGCSAWRSKADVVADVTRSYIESDRILDKSLVGNHLWLLVKGLTPDGTEVRMVVLYLIQCHRGEWMHKGISEDMGPSYHTCPKRLIDGASAPINKYSRDWRAKVAAIRDAKRIAKRARRES